MFLKLYVNNMNQKVCQFNTELQKTKLENLIICKQMISISKKKLKSQIPHHFIAEIMIKIWRKLSEDKK
jgi:hypothetical protein